jgi:predicted ATPase
MLASLGWQREAAYVNGLVADVLAWAGQKSEAIAIARNQSAKLFELQACSGLARLWLRRGRPTDVQVLLEPVHAWFTEGLTLPDLREAQDLLAEGSL